MRKPLHAWPGNSSGFEDQRPFRHRVHAAEMPPIPEIALMIGCPSLPFGYFPDNFRGMGRGRGYERR